MKVPKIIFLQVGEDDELGTEPEWSGVTWARERINDNDLKYLLAVDHHDVDDYYNL